MSLDQDNALSIYTIYNHPSDYPGEFVCRVWRIRGDCMIADQDLFARGETLELVRSQLPPGLQCLGRYRADDPKIAESWV